MYLIEKQCSESTVIISVIRLLIEVCDRIKSSLLYIFISWVAKYLNIAITFISAIVAF